MPSATFLIERVSGVLVDRLIVSQILPSKQWAEVPLGLRQHLPGLIEDVPLAEHQRVKYMHDGVPSCRPGGPVVIILATGTKVRGFKPGRSRWIFSEGKNPEYDFLRKEIKPFVPCRRFTTSKRTSNRN